MRVCSPHAKKLQYSLKIVCLTLHPHHTPSSPIRSCLQFPSTFHVNFAVILSMCTRVLVCVCVCLRRLSLSLSRQSRNTHAHPHVKKLTWLQKNCQITFYSKIPCYPRIVCNLLVPRTIVLSSAVCNVFFHFSFCPVYINCEMC